MRIEQGTLVPASNFRAEARPAGELGGQRCGQGYPELGLLIDAIHFGGDDQAIHGRRAPSAAIRAAEQPGFSPKSDASPACFGGIVGEAKPPVLQEESEARPSLQDAVERLGQVVPRDSLASCLKVLDQRPA